MTPRPVDLASVQAKLRSHEYTRADLSIVAAAVPVAKRDLGAFVRQAADWIQRQR